MIENYIKFLLITCFIINNAFCAPCPACSKYKGDTYHSPSTTRMGNCKSGIIPKGYVAYGRKHGRVNCNRCYLNSAHGSYTKINICNACNGTGDIDIKSKNKILDIEEPEKKIITENKNKKQFEHEIETLNTKFCNLCDEDGKIESNKKIECSLCENGYNHKRVVNNLFECRLCGKKHNNRYTKCCEFDCPECKKERRYLLENGKKEICPLCNGDKIITPIEEEIYNKKFKKEENIN